ncbi:MAG: PA14 domain-containing protein [Saprospiraceae bacterium]|nr:PA14 domain-containing protein [Saprospiraceae bacterium]
MKIKIIYIVCILFYAFHTTAQICPGEEGVLQWELWQGLIDDEIDQLTAMPDYPTRPSLTKPVFRLQTPINYDNKLGSRIRGFIYVPSTTDVTFNLTGDDKAQFFLSTDEYPENMTLASNLPGYTSIANHDEYPEQTSDVITLQPNINYYFELLHVEGSGGDHATVYWKTDLVDTSTWNIITASYLKGVDCLVDMCPEEGTACNDGDSTTENDIEDGFCNCMGSKISTNNCIGERGKILNYRYDNIPGSYLNDLYEAPTFPGTPDYSESLDQLGTPSVNVVDNFGTLIQAYLTVPVSGNYKFNVTGNYNAILFISSNDDPENKQAHQALLTSSTGMTEHDKFIWQSTSFIYLEANTYYYVELNHKDGSGSEHFSAFWQTPFTEAGVWKRIPDLYFYDYDCEVACIPENTVCDDGNIFTNNDMYNDACECVGTPCSGPDCDSPLANYVPYDKCSVTDQLDNNPENNWLSCTTTANPNPMRSEGHWIMYDLGARHELHQTQVWNYNVLNETEKGFENVAIDYSDDGVSWSEYGSYTWPMAPGNSGYSGFSGPDFQGTYARYVMITCLDIDPECKGLGKIAFTAVYCPLVGTACDDGDIYTLDDKYDSNCECVGIPFDENDCLEESITLGDSTLFTEKYSAEQYINSISQIAGDNVVSFIGGQSIVLDVGFETGENTLFLAAIDTCEESAERVALLESRQDIIDKIKEAQELAKIEGLKLIPVENSDEQIIQFYLPKGGKVKLSISDKSGATVFTLLEHEFKNSGVYTKRIRTKKFDSGIFNVELNVDDAIEYERLVVL